MHHWPNLLTFVSQDRNKKTIFYEYSCFKKYLFCPCSVQSRSCISFHYLESQLLRYSMSLLFLWFSIFLLQRKLSPSKWSYSCVVYCQLSKYADLCCKYAIYFQWKAVSSELFQFTLIFKPYLRHSMETFSASLTLCEPGGFHAQGGSNAGFNVLFDVSLSKRLSNRSSAGDLRRRALQWRHNEYDGIAKKRPQDCLLNRLLFAFVRAIHRWQRASNSENVSIWWRHHDDGHCNITNADTAMSIAWSVQYP